MKYTEVNVRFEQNSYIVSENMMMEVCVIIDELFELPIMVIVRATPGTAEGNITALQL